MESFLWFPLKFASAHFVTQQGSDPCTGEYTHVFHSGLFIHAYRFTCQLLQPSGYRPLEKWLSHQCRHQLCECAPQMPGDRHLHILDLRLHIFYSNFLADCSEFSPFLQNQYNITILWNWELKCLLKVGLYFTEVLHRLKVVLSFLGCPLKWKTLEHWRQLLHHCSVHF